MFEAKSCREDETHSTIIEQTISVISIVISGA